VPALCEREREPLERRALIEHRPRVPPVGSPGRDQNPDEVVGLLLWASSQTSAPGWTG